MKPRAVAILVCSGCSLAAAAIGAAALVVVLRKARGRRRLEEARSKWAKAGENVVVLHQFPRAAIRNCLSASPFAVKLETFLRMANIKYVTDTDFPLSPATGTGPWITINSEEISDSQLVLEALTRKFGNDVSSHLAPKERCVARSFRIMLEEHFYWTVMADRWVNQDGKMAQKLYGDCDDSYVEQRCCFAALVSNRIEKMRLKADTHGLTRLGRGNVQKMGIEDLEAISTFLGSKSYVMGGDKPSEIDAVLFAFMAVVVHTSDEGGIFKTLIEKRLTNLNQHMVRMKNKFFPDWDVLVNGPVKANAANASSNSGGAAETKKVPPPKPEQPPTPQKNKAAPKK